MSYQQLEQHFRRIGQLKEIEAIVEWDQAVNMPEGAGPARAEAMASLAVVHHTALTDPRLADWVGQARNQPDLGAWEAANLREMERLWRRARAVPADLVEASAKANKTSEQAWRRYRSDNDYPSYAPYLRRVVELQTQVGQALADELGCSTYDALLDEYEPGARSAGIDALFAELRAFLPQFTEQAIEHQRAATPRQLRGPFPVEQQRALGLEMMVAVGFDPRAGRLDVSHHPFCGGVPRDVRITTRYDEADFSSALMGVLHEAGHGKYEQGLPQQWNHLPVGLARGMALHESQSLLLEMQVCRSPEFIAFAAPKIRAAFSDQSEQDPGAYAEENLAALQARVEPGLIRVDADEVTYPAHVLLRYDLERKLLSSELPVDDLPEAWDAMMKELLGLSTAGDDANGCMQDVHWPSGAFGYFPLYTLGALAAAQLYAAARRDIEELPETIQVGNFEPLNAWLCKAVWRKASSESAAAIITGATGEQLSTKSFIAHLKRRYLE